MPVKQAQKAKKAPKATKKSDRVRIGYSGSYVANMMWFNEKDALKNRLRKTKEKAKRAKIKQKIAEIDEKMENNCSPVYVTREKYERLMKAKKMYNELKEYEYWMD